MDGEFSDSDDEVPLTIQQKVSKRLAALETLIMEETGGVNTGRMTNGTPCHQTRRTYQWRKTPGEAVEAN